MTLCLLIYFLPLDISDLMFWKLACSTKLDGVLFVAGQTFRNG